MILKLTDIMFGREPVIRPVMFLTGEQTYRSGDAYKGKNIVIQCPETMDNDEFYSLLQIIDCIRKFSNPYVFMPYFKGGRQHRDSQAPYATMDAKLNTRLLYAAGAQDVYTIDLHSPSTTPEIGNLSPYEDLVRYLSGKKIDVVIAPDQGAKTRAKELAMFLGAKVGQYTKNRDGNNVEVMYDEYSPELKGKNCIIVDDIISSGTTMLKVIDDVRSRGGQIREVFATHCNLQEFTPFVERGIDIVGVTGSPDIALSGCKTPSLVDEFAQRIDDEVNR